MDLLVLIVTVLVTELRCFYSKPVYINHDEKFRNIAVTSDFVYIGGNSKIIKLDSSLIQLNQKYVSMEGGKSIYDENWLLTTDNNASLIVCNYDDSKYNTLCLKLKLDLSVVTSSLSLQSNKPSTKYLATTIKQSNVLIIASSTCLSYNSNKHCLAISTYSLDSFLYESTQNRDYLVDYLQQARHVTFRAVLEIEKFVYFLFNTEDGQSKLGKMCTSDDKSKTNSFEDTPIICSQDGKNYTLAHDAVHWKDHLFIAFTDDSLNVICKYKIRNMSNNFMESRQNRLECPYDNAVNAYFREQGIEGIFLIKRQDSVKRL
ncbi:Hypothetical predicted protein [Mytilus galloprovincialis]|uniref:Sema domain-containing protein n=1 Tax=Mytilus galloprovincialis TaxID=29158 RepID=A0A8B6DLR7_MYTGA|nr:Hypothetical predicted protein [Mytilus galloprovincialis]